MEIIQREIKFNAWDLLSKEMCTVDAMFWYSKDEADEATIEGLHIEGKRPNGTAMVMEPNEYVLLQYTEEKDKNGREIYDGDVVVIPAGYGGDNLYKRSLGIVESAGTEWVVDSQNLSNFSWNELEVVDNKFEMDIETVGMNLLFEAQEESLKEIWDTPEMNVWDDLHEKMNDNKE